LVDDVPRFAEIESNLFHSSLLSECQHSREESSDDSVNSDDFLPKEPSEDHRKGASDAIDLTSEKRRFCFTMKMTAVVSVFLRNFRHDVDIQP
jgi:hypothetical protein